MELNVEQIAKITHETNRAFCQTIGDDSQQPWENAPEWQKESARKGVLSHLHCHANGVPLGPGQSHNCWLSEKKTAGWKYGPVKDPDKKGNYIHESQGDV